MNDQEIESNAFSKSISKSIPGMHKKCVTQRQGVITCIPNEGKSKEFLKNWRPITLLNSTYKLASSCIAEQHIVKRYREAKGPLV
jgi:hypothetical protein